jgi:xanthine dehydrogenase accessory factor
LTFDKPDLLEAFLASDPDAVLVTVSAAKGSTPRDEGAPMLVSASATFGTIGGGQLEYAAIDKARQMLTSGEALSSLMINLGPETGQCCGGGVSLSLDTLAVKRRAELLALAGQENANRPHVYIFGAGHVGNALASAFALLPVKTILADQREQELAAAPSSVERLHLALPEQLVKRAPAGSAFLVLTHDHALDFLIVREALERSDASYVGMIGSKSKRGTFKNWYLREGGTAHALSKLVSPIGGRGVIDKRPAIIAALAAAEVIAALFQKTAASQNLETAHV